MTVSTYRKNPTDKQQNEIESAAFEGGVPVHGGQKTRVVTKQLGGAQNTNHGVGGDINVGRNAGVSMAWDDKSGKFLGDTTGKR